MTIEVSGGAGGVTARHEDMRSHAGVLDAAGDEVRQWADDVARVALDESVVASALLCPAEAAAVGIAVGDASLSMITLSTRMEGSALVLRASVETYELVDATRQQVLEALDRVGGLMLGRALPGLLLGSGLVLATNPALVAALGLTVERDPEGALTALQETLFENPWLLEQITQSAPWIVQGASTSIAGLPLSWLLSGGTWPTSDYESAVAGLVALGGLGGGFQDLGDFDPVQVGEHRGEAPTSVAGIFDQQSSLGRPGSEGQIQVVRVPGPDGTSSWVVQIPGTQDWSPVRGDNPVDLTTNVNLMAGEQTALQEAIAEAMHAAGVDPSDPVMLTGHSQGGIAAASLASDPGFREQFNVRSVVTGGSPVARFHIPDDVSVLSIEHDQDVVPMLEGRENPDRPNWVTVERDASDSVELADEGYTVGAVHGTGVYAETGAVVDGSEDPSIAAWREANEHFLAGDRYGEPRVDRYRLEAGQ